MRSTVVVAWVAAGLLGWGLPRSAYACCKPPDQMARDQALKAGASAAPEASPAAPSKGRVAAIVGRGTTTAPGVHPPASDLQAYIQAREQLAREDPDLERALEAREFRGEASRLEPALTGAGVRMSAEDFLHWHRIVLDNPELTAQINQQVAAKSRGSAHP